MFFKFILHNFFVYILKETIVAFYPIAFDGCYLLKIILQFLQQPATKTLIKDL